MRGGCSCGERALGREQLSPAQAARRVKAVKKLAYEE